MNEKERREAAQAALGGDVVSAREVKPRAVMQMISVRVEPSVAAALRQVAGDRGIKVSDLIREAILAAISSHNPREIELRTWVKPATASLRFVPDFGSHSGTTSWGVRPSPSSVA